MYVCTCIGNMKTSRFPKPPSAKTQASAATIQLRNRYQTGISQCKLRINMDTSLVRHFRGDTQNNLKTFTHEYSNLGVSGMTFMLNLKGEHDDIYQDLFNVPSAR